MRRDDDDGFDGEDEIDDEELLEEELSDEEILAEIDSELGLSSDDARLGDPGRQIRADIKEAAARLSMKEARWLVDTYYVFQKSRVRRAHQVRAAKEAKEENTCMMHFFGRYQGIENDIRKALGIFADQFEVGRWARNQCGVDKVISSALLAYIPIERTPKPSNLYRFCGYDPSVMWLGKKGSKALMKQITTETVWLRNCSKDDVEATIKKLAGRSKKKAERLIVGEAQSHSPDETLAPNLVGIYDVKEAKTLTQAHIDRIAQVTNRKAENLVKLATMPPPPKKDGKPRANRPLDIKNMTNALARRPWNERLHTLGYKIGECFVRTKNNPKSYYGKLYAERKCQEEEKNARGEFAEYAAEMLRRRPGLGKGTVTYKALIKGRLSQAQIHARARRWAVKIFLGHWLQVARESVGLPWVKPWINTELAERAGLGRHEHKPPPGWPLAEEPARKRRAIAKKEGNRIETVRHVNIISSV